MARYLYKESLIYFVHHLLDRIRFDDKFHMSRLYPRHVKNIIHQLKQQLIVGMYCVDKQFLVILGVVISWHGEQVGESHDGIERSAYLMTHICKERLLERCLLCKFSRFLQFLLTLLEIVNIHNQSIRLIEIAMTIHDTLSSHLIPMISAITPEVGLDVGCPTLSFIDMLHEFFITRSCLWSHHTEILLQGDDLRSLSMVNPESVPEVHVIVAHALPSIRTTVLHGKIIEVVLLFQSQLGFLLLPSCIHQKLHIEHNNSNNRYQQNSYQHPEKNLMSLFP